MTLSSAYIELFIRGEKSGGKCPNTRPTSGIAKGGLGG